MINFKKIFKFCYQIIENNKNSYLIRLQKSRNCVFGISNGRLELLSSYFGIRDFALIGLGRAHVGEYVLKRNMYMFLELFGSVLGELTLRKEWRKEYHKVHFVGGRRQH